MNKVEILILGAGPTGLGAAYRLHELGIEDFLLYEKRNYVGGLATSFRDEKGFWWDIGGHVQFSHYRYFDSLMDKLLENNWLYHERESWVWEFNRFIPYPYQLNIHRLPRQKMLECLDGLIQVYQEKSISKPKNFAEWIYQTAGPGIAKYFLTPYNFKVWAYETKTLNADWVGERVAVTDLKRVIHNILNNTDDVSWGPNNTFRFPKAGGTGAIWKALGQKIPSEKIILNQEAIAIDTDKKIVHFADGHEVAYSYLVTTIPLDKFTLMTNLDQKLKITASLLRHSSTHVVGIGLVGQPKTELSTKCWMYFPESDCPFYRVTVFSHYSPENVPDISRQWSLMTETASSSDKEINTNSIISEVIQGLRNTNLLSDKDRIITRWYHQEIYGYPTPGIERDAILNTIQPELMKKNIFSRGRFGMWKYEVSNQDHSLMQGVEVVNYIVHKIPEITAWFPAVANNHQKP